MRLRDSDAARELAAGLVDRAFFGSDFLGELDIRDMEVSDEFVPERDNKPRFALMGRATKASELDSILNTGSEEMSVATSNPRQLERYVKENSLNMGQILVAQGSIESYPARGITDLAFDIVESGNTMRAAGLDILQEDQPLSILVLTGIELAQNDMESRLAAIDVVVESRLSQPTDSETSRILASDNNVLKKMGEEFAETITAFSGGCSDEYIGEAADLMQWMRAAAIRRGVKMTDILNEDIERSLR